MKKRANTREPIPIKKRILLEKQFPVEKLHPTKGRILRGGKIVGKAILLTLAVGGILAVGAIAPNIFSAIQGFRRMKDQKWFHDPKVREKKVIDSFTYLRNKGLIRAVYRGKQLYISLTPEGRKRAKQYHIDSLSVERQKKWDGIWRIVIFDIEEKKKFAREAFRGKLKELGFYKIQKSVWLHAYPCEKEIQILRGFFGFGGLRCMCFEVRELPKEIERGVLAYFQLS